MSLAGNYGFQDSEPLIGCTVQYILLGRITGGVVVAATNKHREAALRERGRIELQAQDTNSAPSARRPPAEPEEAQRVGRSA